MKLEEMKMKELFDMSHTIAEGSLTITHIHGRYCRRSAISSVLWDPFFLKMSIGRSVKISGSIKLQRLRLRL